MLTNVSMDAVAFLKKVVSDIEDDVDYPYDGAYMDEDKAHAAFQRIAGRIEALKAFLNAIEVQDANSGNQSK